MGVAEKLGAFRYSTSGHEVSWKHIRAVDLTLFQHHAPDLRLMKNLISMVSDCMLTAPSLHAVPHDDLAQLLRVMQLALQFTLWSQNVIKEQLMDKQHGDAVHRVGLGYMNRIEAQNEELSRKLKEVTTERDTLSSASTALNKRLTQLEATISRVEKELGYERQRSAKMVQSVLHSKQLASAKKANDGIEPIAATQLNVPVNPYVDERGGIRWEQDVSGTRHCPLCHRRAKGQQPHCHSHTGSPNEDDATTISDYSWQSHGSSRDVANRRGRRHAGDSEMVARHDHPYVDWVSLTRLLREQAIGQPTVWTPHPGVPNFNSHREAEATQPQELRVAQASQLNVSAQDHNDKLEKVCSTVQMMGSDIQDHITRCLRSAQEERQHIVGEFTQLRTTLRDEQERGRIEFLECLERFYSNIRQCVEEAMGAREQQQADRTISPPGRRSGMCATGVAVDAQGRPTPLIQPKPMRAVTSVSLASSTRSIHALPMDEQRSGKASWGGGSPLTLDLIPPSIDGVSCKRGEFDAPSLHSVSKSGDGHQRAAAGRPTNMKQTEETISTPIEVPVVCTRVTDARDGALLSNFNHTSTTLRSDGSGCTGDGVRCALYEGADGADGADGLNGGELFRSASRATTVPLSNGEKPLQDKLVGVSPVSVRQLLVSASETEDEGEKEREVPCTHCRQRHRSSSLADHQETCELRLLKCPNCKRNVVARLMPRHVCGNGGSSSSCWSKSLNDSGISEGNASANRTSSMSLQEAQRELEALLAEEEQVNSKSV